MAQALLAKFPLVGLETVAAHARYILAFPIIWPSVIDSVTAGFVIFEALADACAHR